MITKARFQKIVALSDSEKKIPDIFDFDSMTRKEMEEFIANKNFPCSLVKINPNDIYELLKNGSTDDENLCRSYIRKILFKVLKDRKKDFGFDENNPVIKNAYDLSNLKQRLNWTPLIGVQKKKVKRERPPVTLKQPEVFLWQKASSTLSWPRP